MQNSTYAPVYCAIYPALANVVRSHGYALAIHGSLSRDMDLICIPWVEKPSKPNIVVKDITKNFNIRLIGKPENKLHNRIAYTISIGHGECALDLSFMPTVNYI